MGGGDLGWLPRFLFFVAFFSHLLNFEESISLLRKQIFLPGAQLPIALDFGLTKNNKKTTVVGGHLRLNKV